MACNTRNEEYEKARLKAMADGNIAAFYKDRIDDTIELNKKREKILEEINIHKKELILKEANLRIFKNTQEKEIKELKNKIKLLQIKERDTYI